MDKNELPGFVLRQAFSFAVPSSQIGFPFVPITANFCNHVRKGVIESHVGGLHERPGLSFQHLIFVPGPLLDELCSPAELLDQLPTHTGKFEVLLGSPDAVARVVEPCR